MKRGSEGFSIGPLHLHREEQWDLSRSGSLFPLLCVHLTRGNTVTRVLAIWKWGVMVRRPGHKSRVFERRIDSVIRQESL